MPVRKIKKNYRSTTGIFYSIKNERGIAYESTLERDFFLQLEFDSTVNKYEEQPISIRNISKNGWRRYTADCIAVRDGISTVYEVKYIIDLEMGGDKMRNKHADVSQFLTKLGHDFQIVTEKDIRGHRIDNLKFLYPHLQMEPEQLVCTEILQNIPAQGISIQALFDNIAKAMEKRAIFLPTLWHLVGMKYILIDLDQPIVMDSLLRPGNI